MRSSQWYILGITLMGIGMMFIYMDPIACGGLEMDHPLDKIDIYQCINSEILDPFINLLFPLSYAFILCGFIESYTEAKKK